MKKKNRLVEDIFYDAMLVAFIVLIGSLFFFPKEQFKLEARLVTQTVTKIDTIYLERETKPANRSGHVTYGMLDSLAPYPLLAYTTVILESGWENRKSYLARAANNNIGMMVPRTRFNAATEKDTAAINRMGLVMGDSTYHYNYWVHRGDTVRNKRGEKLVGVNNGRWAIFLSPVDCARDIGEYQAKFISPDHAANPQAYLRRLRQLNYFTASDVKAGYLAKWLKIYRKLEKDFKSNNLRITDSSNGVSSEHSF